MIEIGKYNTLKIARNTNIGLYLTDGDKDVLLPNKYVPIEYEIDEEIDVFVYLDHEERPVATTLEPYIVLNEFSLLRVNYVNKFGAFMDWGLEKDLFVPFKEQARPMEEGKRYLVYMYLDKQTNRLVGSSRLNQFLSNQNLSVENGEEVDLIVSHISDTGINVIINEKHKGLIYKDQIFEDLRTGDRIIGYIKNIRPDGKIDVSRQPLGFERIDVSAQKILDELKAGRGMLKLHDNSSPEDIKTILQMSKKTFKKAIGTLYRQKMIELRPDGIYLVKE
ncbi:GntR family transcriptional regulator [Flavobacterium columnare NBRC 100251 = ATCC 23463]|uniref:Nucleic acid-binding domain-containing protein n=2 Tax=Flavobacterium columnare TaxID=996 RepID=G8X644_FLACA|nr:S1-like domain-containing RNA-binding protein [Flavobacterium columnare]AEW86274.1 nucleic acid-binding domain-containing protein [Flavobacterium columnare ATCC 49512]AMO19973.1 GntR family transcriptional regulator [Flavobacterium columnare]ANO48521.1 nucleic acid-binding domain-containing protein [Flavobacterium columnare]APT23425.1 GntR family transcriptional regulator [Flavobacterium columnare]MBF6652792.1 GntR family transcriptional regulator [Flavobacterium columnare]